MIGADDVDTPVFDLLGTARMQCRINAAARRRYARTALELFTALLPDRQRIQGRDHPDTLATRHNIALWTGRRARRAEPATCSRRCCPT
ncbi:MAG TPA: hypothetical protein VK280_00770 [Streptosporangiaceae bacterium]|nr:hypothetical protein [Streptosporangiaceae bacterium]